MKRSSFTPKPCKECGSPYHSKSYHKPRKPLNKVGKVQKQTMSYVEAWKRKQKPNHQGYYQCYISGVWVDYLMAEHPYSKVRHPDQRTNQTLEPVSAAINKLKGSMDIEDFLETYPEYKLTVKPKYLKTID